MALSTTSEIFKQFQEYMENEFERKEEIRNVVRDMEQNARSIIAILQGVHQPDGIVKVCELCQAARGILPEIQKQFQTLDTKTPKDQYYRFHDDWRFIMQRMSFLCALIHYLETGALISHQACADMLAVKSQREEGFHLDLDDFLMGLLQLASELSRLAVNAVTAGDYARPKKIASFMGDLDSGFRLLNLKNDALRKRFDALKYDLQKVEGVVYDVQIRGLDSAGAVQPPSSSQ